MNHKNWDYGDYIYEANSQQLKQIEIAGQKHKEFT